ncbi:1-aminocyclopropane-1-carboxylate deaminase/D-cysteine desulfhydrase [Gilvibacter sp.]|uniref:1-aminocyclopropane-1-carboxylate deaminase/D-cysteine desulfhydrase n=1 Tax=Gilvibacter sp. TaxID=2729997 RepID=UPI0035BE235A
MRGSITVIKTFEHETRLHLLREDLIGGAVQGNKYRKINYNLQEAKRLEAKTLLTFGGAYSNHIAAVAAAAQQFGFKAIGYIRGDELATKWKNNPSLFQAAQRGMEFRFISRSDYRQRNEAEFLEQLQSEYPQAYIIPEGGTNALALKGCAEILGAHTAVYDYICVPVGTGGTIAGMSQTAEGHQHLMGFSALQGDFLKREIARLTPATNWSLNADFAFGGYGKINAALITFINQFNKEYGIALDPVYTGKMLYGLFALLKASKFPENSRILAVHTGGLQGIAGMRQKIAQKGLPPLEI